MTEEINEIIKKNLPQQVGEVLKARLQKADLDELSLKTLRQDNDNFKKQVNDLNSKLEDYKKFDSRNSELDTREKAILQKENNQKVFEAELKSTEADKRAGRTVGVGADSVQVTCVQDKLRIVPK